MQPRWQTPVLMAMQQHGGRAKAVDAPRPPAAAPSKPADQHDEAATPPPQQQGQD